MATRRAQVALGLSLFGAACAVQQLAREPEAPGALPHLLEKGPQGVKAPGKAQPSVVELDLAAFRPVLLEPSFARAKALVDQGSPALAARQLWPKPSPATSELSAEVTFVAGLLFREAGAFEESERAFATAAEWMGPLRADAFLHAAECAFEAQALNRAREYLAGASSLLGEAHYQRMLASLLSAEGEHARSLEAYRELCRKQCALGDKLRYGAAVVNARKATPSVVWPPEDVSGLVRELALERARNAADAAIDKQVSDLIQDLGGAPFGASDRVLLLRVFVEGAHPDEALAEAQGLEAPAVRSQLTLSERCELDSLHAKAVALARQWGAAADFLRARMDACRGEKEIFPAMLFNAAKYAAADGRDAFAVQKYAELEREFPDSSLADDARLRAARSHKDLGNVARFTDLLSKMPEDYPKGDMTMEGVLELALFSAERSDWGAASLVLERGAALVRRGDSSRGTERSGAERYFLARALDELGQRDKALLEYESLVREVPLSYYMLHAYSRLKEKAPSRAERSLHEGLESAKNSPFALSYPGLLESPIFQRGLGLLRVGDLVEGRRVLETLDLSDERKDSILWMLALLLDRAGDAKAGHQILRGRLTDWLGHYPSGPWRTPWEVGFPRPYHGIVETESRASGVPESLIYGVMREESTFDAEAESPARAYGLMQLIEPTARHVGKPLGLVPTRKSLLQPGVNIRLGSRVLKDLLKMFAVNPSLAIPAYNAGPGRPKRWLRERPSLDFDLWVELIPIRETRRYTKRVLASQAAYAFLYNQESGVDALVLPKRLEAP
jgi:soluble lytic murein transglycosylase